MLSPTWLRRPPALGIQLLQSFRHLTMEVDLLHHEDLTGDVDVEAEGLLEEVPLWLGPDPVGVEPGSAAVSLLLRAVPADLPVFLRHVLVEAEDALPAAHQPLVVVAQVEHRLPRLACLLLTLDGELVVALPHVDQAAPALPSRHPQLGEGPSSLLNTSDIKY